LQENISTYTEKISLIAKLSSSLLSEIRD